MTEKENEEQNEIENEKKTQEDKKFNREYPYRFYFTATLLGRIVVLFYKILSKFLKSEGQFSLSSTNYVSFSGKLKELEYSKETYCDLDGISPYKRVENIICFCECDILYDLWSNKNSQYKNKYPVLHKSLQHCSMVKDKTGVYDTQYYHDWFRPIKRLLSKIIGRK
jgi:hypothetical protein